MLGAAPYNFETIRGYVAAFGRIFSSVRLQRDTGQNILVPISYGPKRTWYVRAKELVDGNNYKAHTVATVVPRMAFSLISTTYDPSRRVSALNRVRTNNSELNQVVRQWQAMPYDFTFELAILVKNTGDGLRIIEQIAPQFRPQLNITVNEIPELNISRDVPIILQDMAQEDTYEGEFTQRQILMWTMSFTVKGYLYPPINDAKVIKKVNAIISNMRTGSEIQTQTTYVDPLTADEWDVDSNGNPLYSINDIITYGSNEVPS